VFQSAFARATVGVKKTAALLRELNELKEYLRWPAVDPSPRAAA
jgi:hypothetical protein